MLEHYHKSELENCDDPSEGQVDAVWVPKAFAGLSFHRLPTEHS